MIGSAFFIAAKDLRLIARSSGIIVQGVLLGLSLIFLFSLAQNPGDMLTPREIAAVFWLSSVFCEILIFNQLYSIEETANCRQGLISSPLPVQSIWLGKVFAALILLGICQAILLPASIIFLNANLCGPFWPGLGIFFICNVGLCSLGSLLGAIGAGQSYKDSVLAVILFPLLMPLLVSAITLSAETLGETVENQKLWFGVGCAFDAFYLAAGLILFGFLYNGDD